MFVYNPNIIYEKTLFVSVFLLVIFVAMHRIMTAYSTPGKSICPWVEPFRRARAPKAEASLYWNPNMQ